MAGAWPQPGEWGVIKKDEDGDNPGDDTDDDDSAVGRTNRTFGAEVDGCGGGRVGAGRASCVIGLENDDDDDGGANCGGEGVNVNPGAACWNVAILISVSGGVGRGASGRTG